MASTRPDYRLKLKRAHAHLQQLNGLVTEWLNSNHNRSHIEPDPNTPKYSVLKASADAIPADPFALLIGDIAQNLRSGLDHIAFQLASNFTKPLPDKIAEDSQFPIIGDKNRKAEMGWGPIMFDSQSHRLAGVDPRATAIIKGAQPYVRGKDFESDPLWRLNQLSNIDKHRVLHLVTAASAGMQIRILKSPMPDNPILYISVIDEGVVEQNTNIATIEFNPAFNAAMYVDVKPTFYIALENSVPDDALRLLSDIYKHIVTDVVQPLATYL